LNAKIKMNEVLKIIKSLKDDTAAGFDGENTIVENL